MTSRRKPEPWPDEGRQQVCDYLDRICGYDPDPLVRWDRQEDPPVAPCSVCGAERWFGQLHCGVVTPPARWKPRPGWTATGPYPWDVQADPGPWDDQARVAVRLKISDHLPCVAGLVLACPRSGAIPLSSERSRFAPGIRTSWQTGPAGQTLEREGKAHMTPIRGRRIAGMLLAAAVGLSGLMTAGPAFAGTSGGHHGHDHFRSQVFKLELNSDNAAAGGTVWAFGPIRGTGTDQQVNDNLDVFTFPKGSVNVAHWAKSHMGPTIDYRSCTATYSEDGVWKIKGGTHKYWGAEGFGRYHLTNFVVLKRLGHDGKFSQANTDHKRGRCDTNPNDEPRFSETTVIAIGVSSVRDHDRDHKQAA